MFVANLVESYQVVLFPALQTAINIYRHFMKTLFWAQRGPQNGYYHYNLKIYFLTIILLSLYYSLCDKVKLSSNATKRQYFCCLFSQRINECTQNV